MSFMNEVEFHQACKDLETRATKSGLDIKYINGDVSFLRITKILTLVNNQASPSHIDPIEHVIEDVIEDREENVVYPATNAQSKSKVEYDIVYSPSYTVPVLHFRVIHEETEAENRLDFIYETLVPSSRSKELQSIGILGGISQTHHPVLDYPCFFVHPCRTSEAMEALLANRQVSAREYLQIWIGLIGSAVGLSLPVQLAV